MATKTKRKASPAFKAWQACWKEEQICPMWGVTAAQKAKVRACVNRKMKG